MVLPRRGRWSQVVSESCPKMVWLVSIVQPRGWTSSGCEGRSEVVSGPRRPSRVCEPCW